MIIFFSVLRAFFPFECSPRAGRMLSTEYSYLSGPPEMVRCGKLQILVSSLYHVTETVVPGLEAHVSLRQQEHTGKEWCVLFGLNKCLQFGVCCQYLKLGRSDMEIQIVQVSIKYQNLGSLGWCLLKAAPAAWEQWLVLGCGLRFYFTADLRAPCPREGHLIDSVYQVHPSSDCIVQKAHGPLQSLITWFITSA